jgi:hypothetical protein
MKVTHCGDEHLISYSAEEVSLLVDLCHAAMFSDFLPTDPDSQKRLKQFLGDVQSSLLPYAQQVGEQRRRKAGLKALLQAEPAAGARRA